MNIQQLIAAKFPVQYVYSYPTTRSYMPVKALSMDQVSLTEEINVYIHIPFCNQKCSFCGYLTVIEKSEGERGMYVNALVKEIKSFASLSKGKIVRSVNFGGGTPSLLSLPQIGKIMDALQTVFPDFLNTATEISMEATPESVTYPLLEYLREKGFNRISIGIQTLNDVEINAVKRHNLSVTSLQAIELVRKAGIPNLCIDLMYGLPQQTDESWKYTIETILDFKPETVELYRTVIIPNTPLSKKEDPALQIGWQKRYDAYQFASEKLTEHGYVQDSHVRFIIPKKGFYDQQSNVFKMQSLIGFGVGARSYATNVHYRNVYQAVNNKTSVREYIYRVETRQSTIESAVFLTPDELARRYIIYNLEHLDCEYLLNAHGFNFMQIYKDTIATLQTLGVCRIEENLFKLHAKSIYHRDLLAYLFFSQRSIELEKAYYGTLLKDW